MTSTMPTTSTPTPTPTPANNNNHKPPRPPTAFEKRVYEATSAIPKGRVSTYGELAKLLKSSPRAVGGALRRNPFAPRVPCHRVVAAGGAALGGFSGTWGSTPETAKKLRMLIEEEVEVVKKKKTRTANSKKKGGDGEGDGNGVEFARAAVMSAAELAAALKSTTTKKNG